MENETFQDFLDRKMQELEVAIKNRKREFAIKKQRERDEQKRKSDTTGELFPDKELNLKNPEDKRKFDEFINKLKSEISTTDIRQVNTQYPKK